jgi:hypothetical protein
MKLGEYLAWQIPGRWQGIKRYLYKKGYRPKPGNPFFSPSYHWLYLLPTPPKEK